MTTKQRLPKLAPALGLLGAVVLLLGEPAATAREARGREPRERTADGCLQAWKETPYRAYGYDHIVAVSNGCTRPASCVITASHGASSTLLVPAGQTERALLFRGSPARDFGAKVTCAFGR